MVHESERQTDEPVLVDLVLADDPVAAEEETERMMAVADRLARASRWCWAPARKEGG